MLGSSADTYDCEVVGDLDSGACSEALLSDWIGNLPRQVLANNLGLPERAFATLNQRRSSIIAA